MEINYALIYLLMQFFSILYLLLIGIYTFGWFRLKRYKTAGADPQVFISIIIAARNEEKNILPCLSSILKQHYPASLFEVIVVDDQSEDQTAKRVEQFIQEHKEYKIHLVGIRENERSGKKEAIARGVEKSKGHLLLTTDADCSMGPEWLKNMAGFYEKERPAMISGPVSYHGEKGFFQKIQSLEFLSLIASGAGAASVNAPIMCNAANLAFEKEAYLKVKEDTTDEKFMSGDDVFLMLKIRKYYGNNSVKFLKSHEAIVHTFAKKKFGSFLHQRLRWVSKSKGYTNLGIITASLIIYLFNYLVFAAFILSIWLPGLLVPSLLMLLVKSLIDLPILLGITSFTRKQDLMIWFPLLQILYIPYISVIGLAGNLVRYSWKGRNG